LNYYSPDIGNFVRTEEYDNNRKLIARIELVDYELGSGGFVRIDDVAFSPVEPKADEKVKIKVRLSNTGTRNLTGVEILLEIDGKRFKTELIDINAQATHDLTFSWTPKEEGEYGIDILTPDDEWGGDLLVGEAEESGVFDLFSSPLSMIMFIVIILIIIVFAVFISRKRREMEQPLYEPPPQTGPSMFDERPPGQQTPPPATGPSQEPEVKVIKYSSGMGQVGTKPSTDRQKTEDNRQQRTLQTRDKRQ
jgi:hypothetical protein